MQKNICVLVIVCIVCVLPGEVRSAQKDQGGPVKIDVDASAKPNCQKWGLYMKNGTLMKADKPYFGIGVNYYSAFSRNIMQTEDRSYKEGFRMLRNKYNIPFIRFNIAGYWPTDYRLYLEFRETYFELLDEFVHEAEQQGLGLIPCFFWHSSIVPDLVGEPMDQLGNPNSKTHTFIKNFVREVIGRYHSSPAIWAWEFGNEYMLATDIPDPGAGVAPVVPFMGTPMKRTSRDKFRRDFVRLACREFAAAVRELDTHRLISTGNAIPRFCAYHLHTESKWHKDNRQQWAQMLLDDNPDPIDSVSVHIYPHYDMQYFPEKVSVSKLIGICNEEAEKAGKVLFLGEFGVPDNPTDKAKERKMFSTFINAIIEHKVPLSAVWVFDFRQQNADWNITDYNDRAYMLEMVQQANERIAAE